MLWCCHMAWRSHTIYIPCRTSACENIYKITQRSHITVGERRLSKCLSIKIESLSVFFWVNKVTSCQLFSSSFLSYHVSQCMENTPNSPQGNDRKTSKYKKWTRLQTFCRNSGAKSACRKKKNFFFYIFTIFFSLVFFSSRWTEWWLTKHADTHCDERCESQRAPPFTSLQIVFSKKKKKKATNTEMFRRRDFKKCLLLLVVVTDGLETWWGHVVPPKGTKSPVSCVSDYWLSKLLVRSSLRLEDSLTPSQLLVQTDERLVLEPPWGLHPQTSRSIRRRLPYLWKQKCKQYQQKRKLTTTALPWLFFVN